MNDKPMTIQVPGKLMIAGEFAVLEPYHQLGVLAVDRFVYATIEASSENSLTLEDFNLDKLDFTFHNNQIEINTTDNRIGFIKDAMTIVYTYLDEQTIRMPKIKLSIKSELDDASGIKYGLGSSAAVVTAVVSAILKFALEQPTKELIFRLAAISHVKTQGNGSGADVAASSYGGLLKYASFQAEWLHNEYTQTSSISALLEKEWKYFALEPIDIPDNIYFCVGWTGKPASTAKLVDIILQLKVSNPFMFDEFLKDSKEAVGYFFKGIEHKDFSLVSKGVKKNRRALATVGMHANAPVETPKLTTLCDLAEELGGAGKPSGAGGGDCGIAFMPSREAADKLIIAWEEAGIKPLALQPSLEGAKLIQKET
ncbi:phosphomevalonate kinase [Oceanobacillus bengalensis]|uniref:phosphomevalonate kinase n=1 Tax=Oceanobacillus bengalensis TaxID=1435466 RepID=A0A494YT16_9BACI|nr:phosphomevalonate kinase [Oceanobacillus bengalensis]